MEACPQCRSTSLAPSSRVLPWQPGEMARLAWRCEECGWEQGDALLTMAEAQDRLLQAAEGLGRYVHASTDPPLPVPAVHLSPAERLRRQALEIEARDAAVIGLRRAARIVRALGGA